MAIMLSARARAMLDRNPPPYPPLSIAEAVTTLASVGCPPIAAFVNYLVRFAGRRYDRADGCTVDFEPSTFSRRPCLSDLISRGGTGGTGRLFHWGCHGSAPFSMDLDESGRIVLDGEIPVASTVEKLVESDSMFDHLARAHGGWTWARGDLRPGRGPELERGLGLSKVVEASDDWSAWWAGPDIAAHRSLVWGGPERGELLWVYAKTPAAMDRILPNLRDLYDRPPALRGWPALGLGPDRMAW